MGKLGASSWLSVVKKALSPTKGSQRRLQHEEEEHEVGFVQKREKKRWIFHKSTPYERTIEHKEAKNIASPYNPRTITTKSTRQENLGLLPVLHDVAVPDQRRAMAVAIATTAVAEAAVATAQAAVEVMRLASPSIIVAENYAAVAIQTAFRGYLARRALKALKGVVRLQAFVRGFNVRKRAEMTLQCMQSLLWVQNQVCYQRKRLSTDSMFSPPKNLYRLAEMKCNSIGNLSSFIEDVDSPHKTKEAVLKREKSLAHAFSHQIWRSEEKSNPRAKIPLPKSPISRQTLLANSLTSPHRSRIRTLKSQSENTTSSETPSSPVPSYMAATESAVARVRSKSVPRQREKERDRESGTRSAKKRLSFAGNDLYSAV